MHYVCQHVCIGPPRPPPNLYAECTVLALYLSARALLKLPHSQKSSIELNIIYAWSLIRMFDYDVYTKKIFPNEFVQYLSVVCVVEG